MTEVEWQAQVIQLARLLGWPHMHVERSTGKGSRWTSATNVTGWPDLTLWSERQQRLILADRGGSFPRFGGRHDFPGGRVRNWVEIAR